MSDETTRRTVLKAVFVAPAILTLTAVPSYASAGSSSHRPDDHEKKPKKDTHPNQGWHGQRPE